MDAVSHRFARTCLSKLTSETHQKFGLIGAQWTWARLCAFSCLVLPLIKCTGSIKWKEALYWIAAHVVDQTCCKLREEGPSDDIEERVFQTALTNSSSTMPDGLIREIRFPTQGAGFRTVSETPRSAFAMVAFVMNAMVCLLDKCGAIIYRDMIHSSQFQRTVYLPFLNELAQRARETHPDACNWYTLRATELERYLNRTKQRTSRDGIAISSVSHSSSTFAADLTSSNTNTVPYPSSSKDDLFHPEESRQMITVSRSIPNDESAMYPFEDVNIDTVRQIFSRSDIQNLWTKLRDIWTSETIQKMNGSEAVIRATYPNTNSLLIDPILSIDGTDLRSSRIKAIAKTLKAFWFSLLCVAPDEGPASIPFNSYIPKNHTNNRHMRLDYKKSFSNRSNRAVIAISPELEVSETKWIPACIRLLLENVNELKHPERRYIATWMARAFGSRQVSFSQLLFDLSDAGLLQNEATVVYRHDRFKNIESYYNTEMSRLPGTINSEKNENRLKANQLPGVFISGCSKLIQNTTSPADSSSKPKCPYAKTWTNIQQQQQQQQQNLLDIEDIVRKSKTSCCVQAIAAVAPDPKVAANKTQRVTEGGSVLNNPYRIWLYMHDLSQ